MTSPLATGSGVDMELTMLLSASIPLIVINDKMMYVIFHRGKNKDLHALIGPELYHMLQ